MTQIASLLAVGTIFIGLWTLANIYINFCSQGGGIYTRHMYMCTMQELELKVQGGLCARGV